MVEQKKRNRGTRARGQKYKCLLAQGETYRQITSTTGISKSTLIRARRSA